MYSKQAAVVIPVYKPQFSAYEQIALQQCFKVLKSYPIIFVKPGSLTLSPPVPPAVNYEVISFDDEYFVDIEGYNKLMLSTEFYESFTDYQYILIHQLDAFVFSDRLSFWCSQGYDYIGAPWISKKASRNFFSWLNASIKNYLYVRYNVKSNDGLPKIDRQMENRVGNGGFSLRRVELFTNYCIKFKPLSERYISMQHPWFNEDIFWSIELNRKKKNLKIPDLKKGLQFAFETNLETAFSKNNRQLPFGCHAWDKNIDFWQPMFKELGYDI